MSDVSNLRNNLLRGLYEESRKNPQATPTIAELQPYIGDGIAPELVHLVVEELRSSGLISLIGRKARAARPLKLTANGYYEAERLDGVIKTPALARVAKLIKDHQKLGIIIAVLGLVLAIVYPEFKEYFNKRSAEYDLCVGAGTIWSTNHLTERAFYSYQQDVIQCRNKGYTYQQRLEYEREKGIRESDYPAGF